MTWFPSSWNAGWIAVGSQLPHPSRNTVLQSLEIQIFLLFPGYSSALKELLPTIASPVFSEIVVIFPEKDAALPPPGIFGVLREMYLIKGFRLAFCLEALDVSRMSNLRHLMMATQRAVAEGSLDFLPCPPAVFSRTVTEYDRL